MTANQSACYSAPWNEVHSRVDSPHGGQLNQTNQLSISRPVTHSVRPAILCFARFGFGTVQAPHSAWKMQSLWNEKCQGCLPYNLHKVFAE